MEGFAAQHAAKPSVEGSDQGLLRVLGHAPDGGEVCQGHAMQPLHCQQPKALTPTYDTGHSVLEAHACARQGLTSTQCVSMHSWQVSSCSDVGLLEAVQMWRCMNCISRCKEE